MRKILWFKICSPGLGRFPGGKHGNLLQYSCLENPHKQRSLAGYSPWGRKETERLSTAWHSILSAGVHAGQNSTVLHLRKEKLSPRSTQKYFLGWEMGQSKAKPCSPSTNYVMSLSHFAANIMIWYAYDWATDLIWSDVYILQNDYHHKFS